MLKSVLFSLLLVSSAFAADIAGEYKGTFASDAGAAEGKVRLVVAKAADAWDCRIFFSNGGDEISAKTTSCKVEDNKITHEYDAEVDGNAIHVVMSSTIAEDKSLKGTYKAVSPDGEVLDQGTWKASQNQ